MAQQAIGGQSLLNYESSQSHSDIPHSVGLLGTSDQHDAETSTWQHTTRAPCGIPSKRAAEDPRLRRRGQWHHQHTHTHTHTHTHINILMFSDRAS